MMRITKFSEGENTMIIHSIKGAANFLGCSQRTIQNLIKRGEMPQPIQIQESHKTGKIKRLWNSQQLEPLKKKVAVRKKYIPLSARK